MKKFFNYVLLALVTICFALPLGGKAEAAKVAVVRWLIMLPAMNWPVPFTCRRLWCCSVILNLTFWVRM